MTPLPGVADAVAGSRTAASTDAARTVTGLRIGDSSLGDGGKLPRTGVPAGAADRAALGGSSGLALEFAPALNVGG
ncbi:hypothetical protein GCM10027258_82900 [Amycolatopsis stemonae]